MQTLFVLNNNMKTHISIVFFVLCHVVLLGSCGSSDESTQVDEVVIDANSNIRLIFEANSDLDEFKETIEGLVLQANSAVQPLMAVNDVTINVAVDSNQTIPGLGVGGYNPSPNDILIYIDTDFNGLQGSLEAELPAIVAHEMHHAKRQSTIGYGGTLFQAIISEGLADHFSIEALGVNPPRWSTAVQGDRLQDWIDSASQEWNNNSFDFAKWFFGSTSEIPQWTGYSIGYELVKNYLESNAEDMPSNLFDEPANSFLP